MQISIVLCTHEGALFCESNDFEDGRRALLEEVVESWPFLPLPTLVGLHGQLRLCM